MSDLIRIQSLPHINDSLERQHIDIPMTSEDRQRVRRRLEAPDGEVFALELPTGSVLPVGHALFVTAKKIYQVAAAPEDVLCITPKTLDEAALVGHLIGNLHRDIDIFEGQVIALWTEPLEQKVQKAGLDYVRERRPFRGRPAGEHSH